MDLIETAVCNAGRARPSSGTCARRATRALPLVILLIGAACSSNGRPSGAEQTAIADAIGRQVVAAYDPSKPGMEQRMLSLYAPQGRIVSASGGHVVASRDSLTQGIHYFYANVVVNMRQPKWIWDQMLFDVLSPDAAVMTATYHVPHLTPNGQPHTIGGAWTAVFQKENGRWYIIQEHLSDLPAPPMAMDSMTMAKPAKKP